ncbi:hypothetical protein AHiyo6_28320 [Arthrobacter sp. Hiyo6]|nr:hypothetical protein AHiyo6_28320 [Arthrobacter sp. Hiyo6]
MAERDYLLQIAAHDDVTRLITAHSPGALKRLRESPEWGVVTSAWQRAAAVDPSAAEQSLVDELQSATGDDLASAIWSRLLAVAHLGRPSVSVPAASSISHRVDISLLLEEVEHRIGQRHRDIARTALVDDPRWKEALLASLPTTIAPQTRNELIREVASYRDRWDVDSETLPLGPQPATADTVQSTEHSRVHALVSAVAAGSPETNDSRTSGSPNRTSRTVASVQPLDLGS